MLGRGVGGRVVVLSVVAKEWSGESKSGSCLYLRLLGRNMNK
jgi:hypothetical protein